LHKERERFPIEMPQHKMLVKCRDGDQAWTIYTEFTDYRPMCPECGKLMDVITEQEE
jgi:Zn finger protein HypA/HybF involved in hydrogenase expression